MNFGCNYSYMVPKRKDVQVFVKIAQEMERAKLADLWIVRV